MRPCQAGRRQVCDCECSRRKAGVWREEPMVRSWTGRRGQEHGRQADGRVVTDTAGKQMAGW